MFKPAYQTLRGGVAYVRLLLDPDADISKETFLPPEGVTRAVLHIPGLFEPASVMGAFMHRFRTFSGLSVCSFHVGSRARLSFKDLGYLLACRIAHILSECRNLKRLDIVAHSMGGLLAMDAINHGALDGHHCRMVTLGTMHRGAWSALPMCLISKSARDLLPFRKRFHADLSPRLRCVPLLSIAGTSDLFVPLARCRPRHSEHFETVDADHASLLFKKETFLLAHNFLERRDIIFPPIRITGPSG